MEAIMRAVKPGRVTGLGFGGNMINNISERNIIISVVCDPSPKIYYLEVKEKTFITCYKSELKTFSHCASNDHVGGEVYAFGELAKLFSNNQVYVLPSMS